MSLIQLSSEGSVNNSNNNLLVILTEVLKLKKILK